MDVRDLAMDQLAHEDVIALTDSVCGSKNVVRLRMCPPAAADRLAGNRFGQGRE